jgi:curli production assembly/transport component CsgF
MAKVFVSGILAAAFVASTGAAAIAGNLVYRPINPGFGGDPFNSSYLLGIAEANNRYTDPNALDTDALIDEIENSTNSATDSATAATTGTTANTTGTAATSGEASLVEGILNPGN